MNLKMMAAASAITLAPFAASALSVTGLAPGGGPYAIPGGYSSNVEFANADGAGALSWGFINSGSMSQAVTVTFVTVNQAKDFAFFTGGATTSLGTDTHVTAQGVLDSFTLSALVAAGDTITLTFDYGDPVAMQGVTPDFDFNLVSTPVPLPAAAWMLMGALGGLGMLSRKRRTT